MQERCEGQHSCQVEASTDIFGEPCAGVKKVLTAAWWCIEKKAEGYWVITFYTFQLSVLHVEQFCVTG